MGNVLLGGFMSWVFTLRVKGKVVSSSFRGPVLVEVRRQGLLLGRERP